MKIAKRETLNKSQENNDEIDDLKNKYIKMRRTRTKLAGREENI